jgi:hypothetical protein
MTLEGIYLIEVQRDFYLWIFLSYLLNKYEIA